MQGHRRSVARLGIASPFFVASLLDMFKFAQQFSITFYCLLRRNCFVFNILSTVYYFKLYLHNMRLVFFGVRC